MHLKLLPSCQKIREEKKKKNKVICNILFVSILCIIAKEMLKKKKINCNKVILVHGVSACVPGGAGGWGPHRYGPFWGWGPSPCTALLRGPCSILQPSWLPWQREAALLCSVAVTAAVAMGIGEWGQDGGAPVPITSALCSPRPAS